MTQRWKRSRRLGLEALLVVGLALLCLAVSAIAALASLSSFYLLAQFAARLRKTAIYPVFGSRLAPSSPNQPLLARTGSWLWATFLLPAPHSQTG